MQTEAVHAPLSTEQAPGDSQTAKPAPEAATQGMSELPGAPAVHANPAPRPWTPDRRNADGSTTIVLKRACNGCGTRLGDVTDKERARAINGLPLPDVRKECADCGPTAPEPCCLPTVVLLGEPKCLDVECDHERGAEGAPDPVEDTYCDEVREETVCVTHSEISDDGEITHAEPWPCKHTPAVKA